jgi:hypothetical protein
MTDSNNICQRRLLRSQYRPLYRTHNLVVVGSSPTRLTGNTENVRATLIQMLDFDVEEKDDSHSGGNI